MDARASGAGARANGEEDEAQKEEGDGLLCGSQGEHYMYTFVIGLVWAVGIIIY
jgi:hypothetical protein